MTLSDRKRRRRRRIFCRILWQERSEKALFSSLQSPVSNPGPAHPEAAQSELLIFRNPKQKHREEQKRLFCSGKTFLLLSSSDRSGECLLLLSLILEKDSFSVFFLGSMTEFQPLLFFMDAPLTEVIKMTFLQHFPVFSNPSSYPEKRSKLLLLTWIS